MLAPASTRGRPPAWLQRCKFPGPHTPTHPQPHPPTPAGRTCSAPTSLSWPGRRSGSGIARPSAARRSARRRRCGAPPTSASARWVCGGRQQRCRRAGCARAQPLLKPKSRHTQLHPPRFSHTALPAPCPAGRPRRRPGPLPGAAAGAAPGARRALARLRAPRAARPAGGLWGAVRDCLGIATTHCRRHGMPPAVLVLRIAPACMLNPRCPPGALGCRAAAPTPPWSGARPSRCSGTTCRWGCVLGDVGLRCGCISCKRVARPAGCCCALHALSPAGCMLCMRNPCCVCCACCAVLAAPQELYEAVLDQFLDLLDRELKAS